MRDEMGSWEHWQRSEEKREQGCTGIRLSLDVLPALMLLTRTST